MISTLKTLNEERKKKGTASFGTVAGYGFAIIAIGFVFYTVIEPILDTFVTLWSSMPLMSNLFSYTGADKDPTGIVDKVLALLLSGATILLIGYIVTRPLTIAFFRIFGKVVILRFNFFPFKFFHFFFVESEEEIPKEIQEIMDRISGQVAEFGQVFYLPHNHDGSGPSICSKCSKSEPRKAPWLAAGYELVFYQGLQLHYLEINGTWQWIIGFRAFKTSFPSWVQGEGKMCFLTAGVIQTRKSDMVKHQQFFGSGGLKGVHPAVIGKVWTHESLSELLQELNTENLGEMPKDLMD